MKKIKIFSQFVLSFMAFQTIIPSLAQARAFEPLPQRDWSKTLKNWGLYRNESEGSRALRADIGATDVWSIQEGKPEIVVAVIDTGIDPQHQDLSKHLWHNPRDPQAGSFGMNFVSPGKNPIDVHGHGTHVAGIIGAELDPNLGTSGVAHRVTIMPIKYYSESSSGAVNLSHTIEAINFAVDHGARIINYSGGGPEFSEPEYRAIKRAEEKGILFIAAAGNESEDIDQAKNYYFPASYSNPEIPVYQNTGLQRPDNMVVVAATSPQNRLISASNWGKRSVDVAAPGENILSTLPNGRAGTMTGTSQATAFASGVAALILSENPRLTPREVRQIMIESSDRVADLSGKLVAGGHLNALEAVKKARNWNRLKVPEASKILARTQVTQ